jgi:hypothetical protein
MKLIKFSFLFAFLAAFSSCLKGKEDVGGLLNDKGSILTTISEKAYINTDGQNIGAGYDHTNANFNFTKRPNESVKFFTLKISQPRETKMTGPLVVKVTATPISGYTALPAGAVSVTDINVPQSASDLVLYPVFFNVNKALLDPNEEYAVNFTLSSANQGAISELDKSINVVLNYSDFSQSLNVSDYEANYNYSSSVVDPVNQFGINNRKPMYLIQVNPTTIDYMDLYVYALTGAQSDGKNLIVNNFATGARTSLFQPRFTVDASGNITAVLNANGAAAVTNLALDPTGINKFVYTSNTVRTFNVKYTFTLTTTINGVVTPRTVRVSEDFSYDANQIYF